MMTIETLQPVNTNCPVIPIAVFKMISEGERMREWLGPFLGDNCGNSNLFHVGNISKTCFIKNQNSRYSTLRLDFGHVFIIVKNVGLELKWTLLQFTNSLYVLYVLAFLWMTFCLFQIFTEELCHSRERCRVPFYNRIVLGVLITSVLIYFCKICDQCKHTSTHTLSMKHMKSSVLMFYFCKTLYSLMHEPLGEKNQVFRKGAFV